jgi:uncharacterized protein (TIGR02996 family)
MEHPDWPLFVAAVVADPDGDTPRLAAADFLEENGDADRSAFIRIQIALARLEGDGLGKSLEADHLRMKERAFLGPMSMQRIWWAAADCPELVVMRYAVGRLQIVGDGADRVTFRRGFIEDVRCPVGEWQRHGVTVRKRLPIRHVALSGCDAATRDHWYEMLPALRGLRILALQGTDPATARWLETHLPGTHVGIA